jgi:hypothetical protein
VAPELAWPSREELGSTMRMFKATGKTQHDASRSSPLADPGGHLVDATLALEHGCAPFSIGR